MGQLSFRHKILLLVLLPLLIATISVTAASIILIQAYGDENIDSIQRHLRASRTTELNNYTTLALSSVKHLYTGNDKTSATQEQAKKILKNLQFGDDGYFFVYDYNGVNIAHPKKPQLEGKNLINLEDINGVRIIDALVKAARTGGNSVSYLWDKPSLGRKTEKLGYALGLDDWKWMVGTGIYSDDIEQAEAALKGELNDNLTFSLVLLTSISILILLFTSLLTTRITLTEGKLADKKLKLLNRKYRDIQEEVRGRIASQIRDEIKKPVDLVIQAIPEGSQTEIRTSLEQIARNANEVSHNLRPTTLDQLGLFPALEQLIDSCQTDNKIEIRYSLPAQATRLTEALETKVYRIVEELINNAMQHAKASSVQIRMRITGDTLHLRYQDNGVGFSVEESRSDTTMGVGFSSIHDQIESEDGTFTIFSTRNVGTLIRMSIPIAV